MRVCFGLGLGLGLGSGLEIEVRINIDMKVLHFKSELGWGDGQAEDQVYG